MAVTPPNTIADQVLAVNLQPVTDYVLVYQPEQSPPERKATPQQIVAAAPLAGVVLNGMVFNNGTLSNAIGAPAAGGIVLSNGSSLVAAGSLAIGLVVANGTTVELATLGTGVSLSAGGTLTFSGLQVANNLSDVASANLARVNINQGTVALSAASSTITVNAASGNFDTVTLASGGGPYTLAIPSNLKAGSSGVIVITQPASGSVQSLTYASGWKFGAPYSNASPPPLTAALGAVDALAWVCPDGTNCLANLNNNFG